MIEKVKLVKDTEQRVILKRGSLPLHCYLHPAHPVTCGDWCPQWEFHEAENEIELILNCTGRQFLFEKENGEWVEYIPIVVP
jgi:hypothetical protein